MIGAPPFILNQHKINTMKITINKNQARINFNTHVHTIISIAKEKAKNGYTTFYYPRPKNQGISSFKLIDTVEKETESTVYGGYKCMGTDDIRFTIRD